MMRAVAAGAGGGLVLASAAVRLAAGDRIRAVADAPVLPVAIVLGAQVRDGWPMGFLRGRLDTTADLIHSGRARVVLASGNGSGESGDEIAAMTDYLVGVGVDRRRIVGDPLGLRTFDTCYRARHTFGVTQAFVVTQGFHAVRTVALARKVGLDVIGVPSECETTRVGYLRNAGREYLFARPLAVVVLLTRTRPTVDSAPDPAVADALALFP